MNRTQYTKKVEVKFPAFNLSIKNIPILTYERLRFYEKYIVLALEKGIEADNLNQLVCVLSDTFNIKMSFVQEFIEMFDALGHLQTNRKGRKNFFTLSSTYQILYDKKDKRIMQAYMSKDTMDFGLLYFLPDAQKFYAQSTIETYKLEPEIYDADDKKLVEQFFENNKNLIAPFVEEFLQKTRPNYVLGPNLDDIELSNLKKCYVNLDLLLNYQYKDGVSSLVDITFDPLFKQDLDEEYFKSVQKQYKTDDSVPKFIKYQDFYQQTTELCDQFLQLDQKRTAAEQQINDLENKIAKLNRNKSKSKNKQKKEESIQKVQDQIKALNEEKDEINQSQKEIFQQEKSLRKDGICSEIISAVLKKYSGKTAMDFVVTQTCLFIDRLMDLLQQNCTDDFEEVFIQFIRAPLTNLVQYIFEFVCGKKQKLATYLNGGFEQIELQKTLSAYGIMPVDIANLKNFFDLINAFGHKAENTNRSGDNNMLIDNFNQKTLHEQEKIIFSIVKLFDKLDFSEDQKRKIYHAT